MPVSDQTGARGRTARAEERRHHLLEIARRLFIQHGFHGTGIAQIASESGIKVGQIYRDFESKEAIVAAICGLDVAAWLEEDVLSAAVQQGDLLAIRAWLDRFIRPEGSDEYRLVTEIMAEAGRNERIAESYRALDTRVMQRLSDALVAIAPARTERAAIDAIAQFIMTFGTGVASRKIVHGEAGAKQASELMDRFLTVEMETLFRCHKTSKCEAPPK